MDGTGQFCQFITGKPPALARWQTAKTQRAKTSAPEAEYGETKLRTHAAYLPVQPLPQFHF